MPRFPRALVLLAIGAFAGLALALTSLFEPAPVAPAARLPVSAVARVDGELVLKTDYEAALKVFEGRSQRKPTLADKREVLEKLVDEELLVSHGLSLGMARADQPTRDALVAAVLAAERALALAEEPSEAQLERFYASRREELERPGPLRVQAIAVRVRTQADALAARMRAEQARARLEAGEALETVRAQLGDPDVLALPDEPLAWDALRERLGPTTAEVLRTLSPGQVSDVLGSGSLLYVVRVLERAPDHSPPLADIREEVLARYRTQALDTALRAKLASLRSSTRIELREPPP